MAARRMTGEGGCDAQNDGVESASDDVMDWSGGAVVNEIGADCRLRTT